LFGENWFSISMILFISLIIVLTSAKRSPGIGILFVIFMIAFVTWARGEGLASLGLTRPESWTMTVVWSLILGILLALASTILIEPLADRLTGSEHDHSLFDGIRGNFKALMKLLVVVWLLVVFLEEAIFRGFLMTELAQLLGTGALETGFNLMFNSILFGVAHWYQGKSGTLSTGIMGLFLGFMFIASGYNLWLPILAHGFIDTVGLWLVYSGHDRRLKMWVEARTKPVV
jgi:uncharacterized protein